MRKLVKCISAALLACLFIVAFYPRVAAQVSGNANAQPQSPANTPQPPQPAQTERRVVDFEADIMRPITVGDSSALNLLGNVVLHHNGAVITCDSAVRYSDQRMECFKRVVVNQGTTYVYGDRADYNGDLNVARVYSPIIKIVDQDATLYTYRFEFNTLEKVGMFSNGGTMSQQENLLEAERGYYYVDNRELVGVGSVQISTPDYQLTSDSIGYNMNTKIARFVTKTYIWNSKGEILSAEEGEYHENTSDYKFTRDAYIITANQEIWADTLDYNSFREDAIGRSNVQIRDDEQKVMAFGDYLEYWGAFENALLTREPSLLSFDESQDSTYMRSDTIFIYSIAYDSTFRGRIDPEVFRRASLQAKNEHETRVNDSINAAERPMVQDTVGIINPTPSPIQDRTQSFQDQTGEQGAASVVLTPAQIAGRDSINAVSPPTPADLLNANADSSSIDGRIDPAVDSVAIDSVSVPVGPPSKAELRAQRQAEKAAARRAVQQERAEQLKLRQERRAEQAAAAREEKLARRNERLRAKSKLRSENSNPTPTQAEQADSLSGALNPVAADSLTVDADSLGNLPMPVIDSLSGTGANVDSLGVAGPNIQPEEVEQDSLQRIIVAYYNVKIFSNSMQAVCDSLIGFSIDSTLHMYVEPFLWSEGNQIGSEVVDLYTKNEQLDKAVFSGGSPIMASKVYEEDTTRFNQVKGRTIEAYFKDNDIHKVDVLGNAQTAYYIVNDETGELNGFLTVESPSITAMFEQRQMVKTIWLGSPVDYNTYPADRIPETVPLYLDGFQWREDLKPTLIDVFRRYVRPSNRAEYENMPLPQFPLTNTINLDREDKIRRRVWVERNDRLSQDAIDFVKEVSGITVGGGQ